MSEAVTPDQRARVGEFYFLSCYPVAVAAAIGLCGVAAAVAVVDHGTNAAGTLVVIGLLLTIAVGASLTRDLRDACYQALRGRAYLLAAPALLVVPLARLWPAVDQNALYFAVAGPVAIVACVAQGPRDGFTAIVLIPAATAAAAAIDNAEPGLASAQQLSTATLGLLLSAVLVKVIVQWGALIAQEGAHLPASPPPAAPRQIAGPLPAIERPLTPPISARPPLTALALGVAEELALWMQAIRTILGSGKARSLAWREVTGFQARELQVLLLLHVHSDEDVARFLSIKVGTVRNTASRAVNRERQAISDPVVAANFTQADLSQELAEIYPTSSELEADALAVEARRVDPWRRG
jgi:DNA-binding CsgD family transcriptional regulator